MLDYLKNDENKADVIVLIVLDVRAEALIHLLTRAYPRQNKVEKYKKIGLTINLKGKSENPGQSIVFKHKKITEWYATNRLQSPSGQYRISDYFDCSIADENDLRNSKEKA